VVVGAAAAELAVTHPERTAACFKRWIGSDRSLELAEREFSAIELSAMVLRSLKADAEAALGSAVTEAVVTVPAYFNQPQREATQRAAELAGLTVSRIVNEPTAAALTYGFHKRGADRRLLVFDLGGGTFDVTVMEIFEGALEIQATAGESRLGGEDFTDKILGRALKHMGRDLELAEFREPLLVARLRLEAERAKRAFGTEDTATLRLPDETGRVDSTCATWELGGGEFEELVEPLLERLRRPTLRALRDAELGPEQVDQILMVGGASRMPVVRRLVTDLFGRPPRDEVHPDHAIALGAAVQAALVADDEAVDDLVATDVCPHTLGVEITKELGSKFVDGYYMPVIHRNTTIPVSREETVGTLYQNQDRILLRVYQGESRRVEDNTLLGKLEVPGLPPGPAGLDVCVRFTYDLSGLLEVEAYVPSTGKKVAAILTQELNGLDKKEIAAAKKRMQSIKFYPREDTANQHLLRYAERCLMELDRFQRESVEAAVEAYEQSMHANDRELFERRRGELLVALSSVDMGYEGAEDGA
jgi:molecular chaperone HscC